MSLKILLADDSMTAQNMGKKILVDAGYEVIAVSNGAAAVKKIAEHKPDIAVLDVYMPGYTGLEVCERVKNAFETSKIPVLLTVGKMEPFKADDGARVKADGLIVKPFEASDLLAAVQKIQQQLSSGMTVGQSTPFSAGQATILITASEPPKYERTIKIKVPFFEEQIESSQALKSQPEEHSEEHLPPSKREDNVSFPTEMRSAPAMGLEHIENEPDASRITQAFESRSTVSFPPPVDGMNSRHEAITEAAEQVTEEEPKHGVGRLFSKAKSWFGGADIPEIEEAEKPGERTHTEGLRSVAPEVESAALPETHAEEIVTLPQPRVQKADANEAMRPFAAVRSYESAPESAAAIGIVPDSKSEISGSGTPAEIVAVEEGSSFTSIFAALWESRNQQQPAQEQASSESFIASEASVAPLTESPAEFAHDSDPDVEFTSPPQEQTGLLEMQPAAAPGLEITSQPSAEQTITERAQDPGLITDISEMSAAFPTRFGKENAEAVPVGNAAAFPELYGQDSRDGVNYISTEQPGPATADAGTPVPADDFEARVSAAMQSGWSAEEAHLEEHEHSLALHEEMRRQSASSQPAEGGASAEASVPVEDTQQLAPEMPPTENIPDQKLAAAMAAAAGADMAPALAEAVSQPEPAEGDATMSLDKHTALIAEIVHRVTERMKPNLVQEIARELAAEISRSKKE